MVDHDGLGKVSNIPDINQQILAIKDTGCSVGEVSDGYHTFDELYDHRCVLFIALCNTYAFEHNGKLGFTAWRTRLHSDGTMFDGYFVAGMTFEFSSNPGQATYHLQNKYWDRFSSKVSILDRAPEYNGHSPTEALERIASFFLIK